ncbi:Glycogen synthase [Luteitalea pratensis]|uniref:Glycogen synthase n=1 Tax=Luteitalea pratensis TaxID=1855912 RepID=A0A143PRE0_LUTPR|nr:glycosyltransferase family 4 protein [Luteitalea pratensis]AMY10384.1 Glycogen synthase [Luteitalea pratensis]
MTIVHVIPFLWSGAGRVVIRLCEAQRRSGHAVHVVTSVNSRGLSDWQPHRRAASRLGVRHHRIDTFDRDPASFWPATGAIGDLLNHLRPAVVHAHAGVPAAAVAMAVAGTTGRPAIVGQLYSWGPNRPAWMDQMDLWGFRNADAVIASARAYHHLLAAGGVEARRLHLVRLGIDVAPEKNQSLRPRPRSGPRLGFVGRIEPRKDQRGLVALLSELRRHQPAVTLDLVGPVADPAYDALVDADIRRLGLEGHVRRVGQVRDVWRHLRSWDLFVSLSTDEGQGLAVLEAMSVGVPVAARSAPGIEDYLEDGRTGIVLRGTSSKHLARALRLGLADVPVLARIARRGAAMVVRRYRWQETIARVEAVYACAIDDAKRRRRT